MRLAAEATKDESEKLSCVQMDTTAAALGDQFALWQSYMRGHSASPLGTTSGFAASGACWLGSPMLVIPSRIDPVRIERSARQIRLDSLDHLNFFLLVEGRWEGKLGKRDVTAQAGDIHIIDATQPLVTAASGPTYTVSVQFPRDLIDESVAPFDMHGLTIPGAAGRWAADFILALVRRLPDVTRGDIQGVVHMTRNVLTAGLAAIPRQQQLPTMAALFAFAKRHIRGNLAADLSPDALSRDLGTSRSTLYRTFEAQGGVETFIREQRLARAHELLANPQERRMITEIASEVGYTSSAHFSRLFRSRFGYPPGEARQRGARPLDELADTSKAEGLKRFQAWKDRLG